MVFSPGACRMGSMVTFPEVESGSESIKGDMGRWKLAAQYIHREMREADEENLLDEEDMHVYGLMPMTDPLDLVCCKSCKKPLKASKYADHAELCKSLVSVEEIAPEVDGGSGHKKPPRKERKKTSAHSTAPTGEPDRNRTVEGSVIGASVTELVEQARDTTSFKLDTIGIKHRNQSSEGSEKNCSYVVWYQIPRKPPDCYVQTQGNSDVPAPLATKIFYSQRNRRLRLALTHLYHESSMKHAYDSANVKLEQESKNASCTSSSYIFQEQIDDQLDKGDKLPLPSGQRDDQISAFSSSEFFDRSGECPPSKNFSTECHLNDVLGPHMTPVEMMRSNSPTSPNSFLAKPGKQIGTMRQTRGSVPVESS